MNIVNEFHFCQTLEMYFKLLEPPIPYEVYECTDNIASYSIRKDKRMNCIGWFAMVLTKPKNSLEILGSEYRFLSNSINVIYVTRATYPTKHMSALITLRNIREDKRMNCIGWLAMVVTKPKFSVWWPIELRVSTVGIQVKSNLKS